MEQERVLYWGSGSFPCWRVMVMLELKELPYESKLLTFSKKEHKSDEVLALNPRGELPTFKDGEAVVNESGGIMVYLETQYPEKPLVPSDPIGKARVWQRFFEAISTQNTFSPYVRPKFRGNEIPNEAAVEESIKTELSRWDSHASQFKFIASDEISLADCMVAPYLLVMRRLGMTLNDCPHLKKYLEMIKDHPAFVKTMPPHWADSESPASFMSIF